MHFSTLLSAAAFVPLTLAGYVLKDDYMTDFYGSFDFFTETDPTHGFVKYVDQATARSMNLINASTTVPVQWGVDTVNKDAAGRASVRLTSKKVYNHGLVVVDVQHMPFGCGTWPAFWMVGPNWPSSGEIDIIEGVHEQAENLITLHTGAGCSIGTDHSVFQGTVDTTNCDIKAAGQDENKGCSIKQSATTSYGAGLNNNGGGVYATEWTSDAITVWFFPRGEVPADALGDSPNPSAWSKPAAKFVKSGCDIDTFFKNQQIVFDTTFCGDWAGNVWSTSTCASKAATCNDFVRDNPSAFTNAFWTINALKVYQSNGAAPSASATVKPSTSATGKPSSAKSSVATVPTGQPTGVPTTSTAVVPTVSPPKSSATAPTSVPGSSRRTRTRHTGPPTGTGTASPNVLATSSSNLAGGSTAGGGTMGGFDWPQPTGGSKPTGNGTATGGPTPSGNKTASAKPTGSGSVSLSSINYSTVPSFSATIPSGLSTSVVTSAKPDTTTTAAATAQPTDLETMPTFGGSSATTAAPAPTVTDSNEVIETVWKTVTVTVEPGAAPTAGSRKARHARMHRKRMVKHNVRR